MKGLGSVAIRDLGAVSMLGRILHFGRAAERCGMAQASLSTLVQRVEKATGVLIFKRTSRSCAMTPDGALVLEAIDKLLKMLDDLERVQDQPGTLAGPIRLGFIPTLGPYLMPHLLPALLERFPQARFFFFEAMTEHLVGMIRSRQVDAGFLSFPSRSEALAEFPLFEEELVLALPWNHRLSALDRVALTDIPRDEIILMDHGHCLRDHTLQVCGGGQISMAPVHATSLETLRFMVGANVGCAIVPALAVAGTPPAADLVAYRKFGDPVPTRTVGLVTLPESEARRRADRLIELVRSIRLPNTMPPSTVPTTAGVAH